MHEYIINENTKNLMLMVVEGTPHVQAFLALKGLKPVEKPVTAEEVKAV
jgi:hypothetical protein